MCDQTTSSHAVSNCVIPAPASQRPAVGQPFARRFSLAAWAVIAGGLLLMGGCDQGGSLPDIATVADFNRVISTSDRPVMIDFYKENCPTCVIQEDVLHRVAQEYGDRVVFAKFKIREATMMGSNPGFMEKYNLLWVPTTILFVNGRERQRWVLNHTEAEFRAELDKVVAPRTAQATGGGASSGYKAPILMNNQNQCVEGQGCPIVKPGTP